MHYKQWSTQHLAFDLDNCLVDTDEMHFTALNRALEPHGTQITPGEHFDTYKALPTKVKLHMLASEERIVAGAIDAISASKQMLTIEAIEDTISPSTEVLSVLSDLIIGGYKMCLCSNCVPESVMALTLAAGIEPYFDFMLSTADVPDRPKPYPDMYVLAAEKFGICTHSLIVVEDGEPGVQAAKAAGCLVIKVDGPEDVTPMKLLPKIYGLLDIVRHRGCGACLR